MRWFSILCMLESIFCAVAFHAVLRGGSFVRRARLFVRFTFSHLTSAVPPPFPPQKAHNFNVCINSLINLQSSSLPSSKHPKLQQTLSRPFVFKVVWGVNGPSQALQGGGSIRRIIGCCFLVGTEADADAVYETDPKILADIPAWRESPSK